MISTFYRGSVKTLLGPIEINQTPSVIFEYTDAYSVFDWGKMPDLLSRKGEALAIMAAEIFEKIEKPETWREFSRSKEALSLRKGNRFGAIFNELGEVLQSEGLRTHYIGSVEALSLRDTIQPVSISAIQEPFRRIAVKQVSAVKPAIASVLGRALPDYYPTRNSPLPRLVPLEIVFRFSCLPESSILKRTQKDSSYLTSLGFPEAKAELNVAWDFPVLEISTKLESTDRMVSLSEALAISGLSAPRLQEVLLKTAWVAGLLRHWFARLGIDLVDGKLEWGLASDGSCFLVDAIGIDELRLIKDGTSLSKEFLRSYYRDTPWFLSLEKAKAAAKSVGTDDWKRLVQGSPPLLSPAYKELAIQMYLCITEGLTQAITQSSGGRKWFPDAWSLDRVVSELKGLKS